MANPFPFVAGSVLQAAELNGIGEAAVSFTPTFSNYTRGNGTSVAYYLRVNKLVYVYVKETLGSTSSVTGSITLTLPIAAVRAEAVQVGRSRIDDTGATIYWGTTQSANGTTCVLFVDNSSTTYTQYGFTSAGVPHVWANTDSFSFSFVYEVA